MLVPAAHLATLGHLRTKHTTQVERRFVEPQRLGRQHGDADGAHRPGVGRHEHLATGHGRQGTRQRGIGGRLALEEDALLELTAAHHAAAVVADHRELKAGEDVVARVAVGQRLGGHVGDEHRAGLTQVGRVDGAPARSPKPAMSSRPCATACSSRNEPVPALHTRFMSDSRMRPPAIADVLGVLAADLDDREAATAVGVEAHGGGRVSDDLVLHHEACAELGVGGPEHRRGRVAAGAGEAHGRHLGAARLSHDLRHQRLRRLHGVAVGAPVDVGHHGPAGGVEQSGLGAGGPEVEAEHEGAGCAGRRRRRRRQPRHRAGALCRRRQAADAPSRAAHQRRRVCRPCCAGRPSPRRGVAQGAERLEGARLRRHLDGHTGQLRERLHHRSDQGAVAHDEHGAVHLLLVVEAVHVAGHALEHAAEEPPVRLALVGEVRELALGEHGTARGHGHAVSARLGQRDGVLQAAAEAAAEALDRLAGARRAALVGLVAHPAAGVTGEHRVAAAADAHHVESAVAVERRRRVLLGDLLRQAADHRRRQTVAVRARGGHAGHGGGAQPTIQLKEGPQRLTQVTLSMRGDGAEVGGFAHLGPRQRSGHLAQVDTYEHAPQSAAVTACRIRHASPVTHGMKYTQVCAARRRNGADAPGC